MALLTEQINPECRRLKESLIKKLYQRKHGPDSSYGQSSLVISHWAVVNGQDNTAMKEFNNQ